jgi:predicted TIM-barrel fold metal-dependent hydrolase
LLDALRRAPQRLRGIAVLQPQDAQALSDGALDAMHAAGVRGLRFTDASAAAFKGNVGIEALPALAARMRQRGWHAQVWMGCRALLEAMPLLQAAQLPVVVDHMGRFDAQAGSKGADFVELCAALADGGAQGWLWVKLSVCRATPDFPDHAQARPFHDALVRANADRVLWASDWPHIRMAEKTPDVGHLLHLLSQWLDDAALRQRILVDNPALLYGFPAV